MVQKENKPIEWEITPEIKCHKCKKSMIEGYSIPDKHRYYCMGCHETKPNPNHFYFKNEPQIIDSMYISNVFSDGLCLQSYPCQHPDIVVELKSFLNDDDMFDYYDQNDEVNVDRFQIDNLYMGGPGVYKLQLLCGIDDPHFNEYSDWVPKIMPNETYEIRPGLIFRVNESFVDPRKF